MGRKRARKAEIIIREEIESTTGVRITDLRRVRYKLELGGESKGKRASTMGKNRCPRISRNNKLRKGKMLSKSRSQTKEGVGCGREGERASFRESASDAEVWVGPGLVSNCHPIAGEGSNRERRLDALVPFY